MSDERPYTLEELREAVERELSVEYAGTVDGQHQFATAPEALLALDAYAREVARRAWEHGTLNIGRREELMHCLRSLGLAEAEGEEE